MRPAVCMLLGGLAGCGGTRPCPTAQVCAKDCCADDSQCVMDPSGDEHCALTCLKSAECGAEAPCCQPILDAEGTYAGSGVCSPNAPVPGAYACLCVTSSECGSNAECVPDIQIPGFVTGPYLCALNDGAQFDGCRGNMVFCTTQGEYCATDKSGNQFCSADCRSDSTCGNTGVACCNTTCSQGNCCGLCGS